MGTSGWAALGAGPAAADGQKPHDKALDLFKQGGEAYRAGDFPKAIDLLSRAYDIEHDPTLLYNLARSYEGLGDFEHAVATYEQYLREVKDINDRAAIEARVANMKKSIDEKARLSKERDDAVSAHATAATSSSAAAPPPPPARRSPSPVPWIIAGVGVAGIGAGAGLGVVALGKNNTAGNAPSQKAAADGHNSAKQLALGSTFAFVVGGVLAGGGITWGVVDIATRGPATTDPTKHDASRLDVRFTIHPAGASLDGTF